MQNLMELDYGWSNLDNSFILKVVQILSSESPINVCRPATAILKKLVEADPGSASGVHAGHCGSSVKLSQECRITAATAAVKYQENEGKSSYSSLIERLRELLFEQGGADDSTASLCPSMPLIRGRGSVDIAQCSRLEAQTRSWLGNVWIRREC